MTSYDDNPGVNISTLKELWAKSPLHYRYRLVHPRKSTPALELGTAVHMCVLEPKRFLATYTVRPADIDGRTKAGKAWLAEHQGQPVLTDADYQKCQDISAALFRHPVARRYLEAGGEAELPIYWQDDETRTACKGRLDLFGPRATVGLKTARSATPGLFQTQAARLGYHLAWAFYHDGLIASGRDPGETVEIVVETSPPYDVVVYVIPDDVLDVGRDEYRSALVRLKHCRATDTWPGCSDEEVDFRLPKWAAPDDDDDLSDLEWETEK